MAVRDALAIEIGPRRIRALLAGRERERLVVKRVLVEDVPGDVHVDDPAAFGAWIGAALRGAGLDRRRAAVAISREHVGLKRLTLPTLDRGELPDMTRLALRRELPFDAEHAVIDFVPVDRDDTRTTVVAVAVPAEVLERTRAVVAAAGLTIDRIGLRALGSLALLRSVPTGGDACVLAVDVTAGASSSVSSRTARSVSPVPRR